jgi:tRNA (guanine37-N1)-methyltransferase
MQIDILSLFPNIAEAALSESIIGKARQKGLVSIRSRNIRDWATDKHKTTDDTPYGGGQGMVMKCEPIFAAIASLQTPETKVIHLSPTGQRFNHSHARRLATPSAHLILLCGHYEGIDQRVLDGALAAAVISDAIVRLLPGVLGDETSAVDDSFATGLLEFPQYTRPVEFNGLRVPDELLSGNHAAIASWRRQKALERTRTRRPDLLDA